jgi:hypothetical protein|nr:MAG TPA: hypothetical protein [Bacteriophage sp.]DAT90895.1 MAG TPA: hypothetical protein [Bacteriophage sp.]DAW61799.1 MAG TPA: hypothetical protein [Caudoviricetes sp.]
MNPFLTLGLISDLTITTIESDKFRKQLVHSSSLTTQHYIRKEKPLNPTK